MPPMRRSRPLSANIFAMCERGPVLDRLKAAEKAGSIIVNSADAIRNTYRHRMIELFAATSCFGAPEPCRRHRREQAAAGCWGVGQALRFPRDTT